ncbi:MAG TPA: hypothetical protein P5293_05740 [Bacteroidales bacterium]|nr:hypothetical protein [Bacteroidales bacterium]
MVNRNFVDEDRNKILVEAMDEDYIEREGKEITEIVSTLYEQDFSTWDGFSHLLEWCKDQNWWEIFIGEHGIVLYKDENDSPNYYFPVDLLSPDKFADAVVEFLEALKESDDDKPEEKDEWRT